jgi:hypothetical protein
MEKEGASILGPQAPTPHGRDECHVDMVGCRLAQLCGRSLD